MRVQPANERAGLAGDLRIMMKIEKLLGRRLGQWAGVVLLSGLLAACGGGGSAGEPVLGGGTGGGVAATTVADLSIVLDKVSVPNTGTEVVKATVTAIDANRAAVAKVPVSFAVDSSGVVKPAGTVTDDKGELQATVEIGSDKTNRTISLTVTTGSISKKVSFAVVDSTVTLPQAASLAVLLDKRTVNNSGTDQVTVTVTAKADSGSVVAGIPITFSVDSNALFVPSGSTTDKNGELTAVVKIGDDKSNRLINLTVKSGLLSKTESFQVTGAKLQPTALPATTVPGAAGVIEYRLNDVNGTPMTKFPVTVTAPGVATSTGTTDDNGYYKFNYVAPNSAGNLAFVATAAGVSVTQNVLIKSGVITIPPANKVITSLPAPVSATPNVLKVNTATTSNQSQIKAVFLAAESTPVQNVRVRFDFNGSSNPNGTLSSGTDLVYSDPQGAAVTSYRAGTTASATGGVIVRACWDYADFDVGTCPNSTTVPLTVVAEGLAVTVGTDDTIQVGASTLTYIKRFVVQVVDAAGNPVGNQEVTPSVDLIAYVKGEYAWDSKKWVSGRYSSDLSARLGDVVFCANEDANRNGTLESGEDFNGNNVLEPRKSDVAVSLIGSTKTDASGQAVLKLEYPKSLAGWVGLTLSVAADVRSPPATWTSLLPVDSDAIKRESPPPAFRASPYGIARSNQCAVPD